MCGNYTCMLIPNGMAKTQSSPKRSLFRTMIKIQLKKDINIIQLRMVERSAGGFKVDIAMVMCWVRGDGEQSKYHALNRTAPSNGWPSREVFEACPRLLLPRKQVHGQGLCMHVNLVSIIEQKYAYIIHIYDMGTQHIYV